MSAISTKKCNYTGGGGEGVNCVHLQNKYRKENFQDIISFKLRKKQNNNKKLKQFGDCSWVLSFNRFIIAERMKDGKC